jgi:hypothetical protein
MTKDMLDNLEKADELGFKPSALAIFLLPAIYLCLTSLHRTLVLIYLYSAFIDVLV